MLIAEQAFQIQACIPRNPILPEQRTYPLLDPLDRKLFAIPDKATRIPHVEEKVIVDLVLATTHPDAAVRNCIVGLNPNDVDFAKRAPAIQKLLEAPDVQKRQNEFAESVKAGEIGPASMPPKGMSATIAKPGVPQLYSRVQRNGARRLAPATSPYPHPDFRRAGPDPRVERTRRRVPMKGKPPSALNPPSGCRFRTHCPIAEERCALQGPPLLEVASGQRGACQFPDG